ncbi:hypothetical protein HPB52_018654 [Rhipicephalus sanguineus]|uniref:Uncharacterized protein n=1 Tax=Rhipicephalus sanguineus TaxID=34632 RepID=A0A9D4Q2P0_RHISA|nr:hypothetical protein HPB52_018654 [Rhipicephalus sanguineus]
MERTLLSSRIERYSSLGRRCSSTRSRRSSSVRSSRRRSSEKSTVRSLASPTRRSSGNCGTALFFSAAFAAAATGLGAYLALCYSGSYCRRPTHKEPDQKENIEPLLQMIWTTANMSLNPCSDFYDYACYNYHHSATEDVSFQHPLANGMIQGLSQSHAGHALLNYHKACLIVQWDSRDAVNSAVRAVFEIFYVNSATVTPLRMFVLIVKLNLVYDLRTDPSIHLDWPDSAVRQHAIISVDARPLDGLGQPSTLFLVADTLDSCVFSSFSKQTKAIYSDVLQELTSVMGANVTFSDFVNLSANLCSVVSNASEYVESRRTILDQLIPGVLSRLWVAVVEEFSGRKLGDAVNHSSIDVLRHRFSVLTDENSQPVALAFVLARAVFELIRDKSSNTPARPSHEYCEMTASQLLPLWVLSALLTFSPKTEHNQVVFSTFDSLVKAIQKELIEFLLPEDVSRAKRELERIKPLLPYHVYPLDIEIPRLGDNHFKNLLRVREYRLTSSRYQTPSGIPGSAAESIMLFFPTLVPGYVTIPLGLYTAAKLKPPMLLQPMALIGLLVADNMWSALFQANLTDAGKKAMSNLRCKHPYENRENALQRSLKWPLRALVSCVRAIGASEWHKKSIIWGQWSTSLSQIFYHLAVVYFYCQDPAQDTNLAKSDVTRFLNGITDFLEAFGCPRRHNLQPICPKKSQTFFAEKRRPLGQLVNHVV